MTALGEALAAEVLRYVYALSIGPWSDPLSKVALAIAGAAVGFALWWLGAMAHPHASRPATPRKENA